MKGNFMKEPTPLLRLIAKKHPIYRHKISNDADQPKSASINFPQQTFFFDFQEITPGFNVARFQNPFHELACEFILELKEIFLPSEDEEKESFLQPVLVCDFPSIDTRRFLQKVLWDEYLQGMILIQFQLKILEQILLFGEDKCSSLLFLTFNEANQDYLEIYERFIISEGQFGENIEIAISTDASVYDDLVDFMEEVNHKFRQTLWSEQRTNLIYRQYLKSEAFI
jgi:hypothetical protein